MSKGGQMSNFRQGPPRDYGGGGYQSRQHQQHRGSPPSQRNLSQSPPPRGSGEIGLGYPKGNDRSAPVRPTPSEEPPLVEPEIAEPEKDKEKDKEKEIPAEPVVVEEILEKNNYNPPELSLDRADLAR